MNRIQLIDNAASKRIFTGAGIFHKKLRLSKSGATEQEVLRASLWIHLATAKQIANAIITPHDQAAESFLKINTRLRTQRTIDAALHTPSKARPFLKSQSNSPH
jgi:hypothetical protein